MSTYHIQAFDELLVGLTTKRDGFQTERDKEVEDTRYRRDRDDKIYASNDAYLKARAMKDAAGNDPAKNKQYLLDIVIGMALDRDSYVASRALEEDADSRIAIELDGKADMTNRCHVLALERNAWANEAEAGGI
jgi:hypothetical protein